MSLNYEREVLRKATKPRTTTRDAGSFTQFFAALMVGVVPVIVCSHAQIFTLEKLQAVLAIFGLILAGAEAYQSGRWLFPVLVGVLVIAAQLRPEMAVAVILICAWDFFQNRPSVGSISLLWFSLAILGGMIL